MILRRWLFVAPMGLLVACGGHENSLAPPRERLFLSLLPISSQKINVYVDGETLLGDQGVPTHLVTRSLDLAIGPGYPDEFEVEVPSGGLKVCGTWIDVELTLESVETTGEGLDVSMRGPNALRLSTTGEGTSSTLVRAGLEYPVQAGCDASEQPLALELTLEVAVREPVGVAFHLPGACVDATVARIESGAPLHYEFDFELLDRQGVAFLPNNADRDRPADVRVIASSDVRMHTPEPDDGIGRFVADGPEGPVLVEVLGDVQPFELVQHASIDAMHVSFALTGYGPITLESGQTYGADGWERGVLLEPTIQPSVVALDVDGEPLCTRALPDAFELYTATPTTCATIADHAHLLRGVPPEAIDRSADLLADGPCELSIVAPGLAGGTGLTTTFAVVMQNTPDLGLSPPRSP